MPDHREHQHNADPTLEQDLGVVEWLHCSGALTAESTGYLCDALLLWTLLGGAWPEPVPPALHPGNGHLEVLAQLHDRWLQRALAEPIGRRLELATVGRLLGAAVRCGRDSQALAGTGGRLSSTLQPAKADRRVP